jgi:hypothetical protein
MSISTAGERQHQTSVPKLRRTTFRTCRLLDFASEKELRAQIGHVRSDWPVVVLKELIDNALDACEEAGTPPEIAVVLNSPLTMWLL